jgi:hypothetical protein
MAYQTRINAVGMSATKVLIAAGGTSVSSFSDVYVLNISGNSVSASLPSRIPNAQNGFRISLTSQSKGILLHPAQDALRSFTIADDLLNFSNPSITTGVYVISLQTPHVSAPSSTKVAVFGTDDYNLQSNNVYGSGVIN